MQDLTKTRRQDDKLRHPRSRDAEEPVSLTIANIREKSPVLRDLESIGSIKIAGSMYNLETGNVEFLA